MLRAPFGRLFGRKTDPTPPDGFGQSLLDDLRFATRFRRCRKIEVAWRRPDDDEAKAIEADPIVGRFGDLTIGVAEIDGRRWIVRERDWHGWPDPPRFAFFVLDQGEVWAGTDFDRWPSGWTWPPEWERVGIHL
jgi:hypothetical protein